MNETVDILLLGAGGREHSLLTKLQESPRAGKIFVAPGNGGMALQAEIAPINQENSVKNNVKKITITNLFGGINKIIIF